MPSLSDRLKSLGVKAGASQLPPAQSLPLDRHPIAEVLPGEWWPTEYGEIFTVETRYPADFKVGHTPLKLAASLKSIAAYVAAADLTNLALEEFAFIDTETTGLAGGAGTYAFLVGIGRFEGQEFRLVQFFLGDPAEEPAQLEAIRSFLAPCQAVVSYNGKSFDLPLLNSRYITNALPPPLQTSIHIDLLHLARRLWKSRLPNCTLGTLEEKILGTIRTEQDVPGWMIPDLYFDYLKSGDARPMRSVFYHNEVDIVSLAALLNLVATQIETPLTTEFEHGQDLLAIGKLFTDLGDFPAAQEVYELGLKHTNLSSAAYWDGLKQLSFLYKKLGHWSAAQELWQQAQQNKEIYAYIELAKMYEHQMKNYEDAYQVTAAAISFVSKNHKDQGFWLPELEHRLNRLQRKMHKSSVR